MIFMILMILNFLFIKTAKNSFDLQLFVNKNGIFLFYPSKIYHLYKWCLKGIVMSRPRSSRWLLNLIKSDLILTPGPHGPGPRCQWPVSPPRRQCCRCVSQPRQKFHPRPQSTNQTHILFQFWIPDKQHCWLLGFVSAGVWKQNRWNYISTQIKCGDNVKTRILGKYHLNFNFS